MSSVGEHELIYTSFGLSTDFLKSVYRLFMGSSEGFGVLLQSVADIWLIYSIIAFFLSALFIYGIVYSFIALNKLAEIESQKLLDAEKLWKEIHEGNTGNVRWQEVQAHLNSDNPNDWKLAIIEADVMLEKMLEDAGYAGNTIADRLRSASNRSFATVDDAWQAHRVRNQIAHGGTDFVLTQRIAKETLIRYQHVFDEFGVI